MGSEMCIRDRFSILGCRIAEIREKRKKRKEEADEKEGRHMTVSGVSAGSGNIFCHYCLFTEGRDDGNA